MNLSRLIPIGIFAVLNLALPSRALAEEAARSPDTALRVAVLLDSRSVLVPTIIGMLPGDTGRELGEHLLARAPEIWLTLDKEYARHLREALTETQLLEVEKFLSSDTGRAWIKATPELAAKLQASTQAPGEFSFRVASIGCVASLLAPIIDGAKQKAGKSTPGVPPELYDKLGPLEAAARETCDCVLAKSLEKWPTMGLAQLQFQPEYQEYVEQLVTAGTCPMPVPKGTG